MTRPAPGAAAGAPQTLGIRRLAAQDWQLFRDIRLEMLADTPTAYVESLEAARSQSADRWQARTAVMSGPGSITFVADDGTPGNPLEALMRVTLKTPQDKGRPVQAVLLSVYVAPSRRGTGLADAMLLVALAAAKDELGAVLVQLGVHEANHRAQRFYQRHGFRDTGRRETYPLDPAAQELVMELNLAGPQRAES